jgi:hypothetical protein
MKRPGRSRYGVLEKADGASRLKLSGVMVKADVALITDVRTRSKMALRSKLNRTRI